MQYADLQDAKKQLSSSIVMLRNKHNIYQSELAKKVGIGRVSMWELENPDVVRHHSVFTINRVAKQLNVTLDELMHGSTAQTAELQLYYKIKKLTPQKREFVESYLMSN